MNEELRELLVILAKALPVGLILGIAMRKLFPQGSKRWAKFCLSRQWKLFAFGVVMFGVLAVSSFWIGRPFFGLFFVIFAVFELYALIKMGFKPLTKEMEERIDRSDPTKLFPLRFWK